MIVVSAAAQTDTNAVPYRLLKLKFDNDFIYLTDRYYSNGVFVEFLSSELQKTPISWVSPNWNNSKQYQGFGLSHFMFTPENIDADTVLVYDRPYCGLFLIENHIEQYLSARGLKLTNSKRNP